jgi:hypothetical protein
MAILELMGLKLEAGAAASQCVEAANRALIRRKDQQIRCHRDFAMRRPGSPP